MLQPYFIGFLLPQTVNQQVEKVNIFKTQKKFFTFRLDFAQFTK